MSTYIIGEIGQNHNGSIDIAKLIVDLSVRPITDPFFGIEFKPIDAIKLTKRDLNAELASKEMNRIYDNPNSFGKTYYEHRKYLELTPEEHYEIYKHAKNKGLDFIETFCAPSVLNMLKLFLPDKLKVASRDLTNIPLLHALAETKIPIILSTGMAFKNQIDDAIEVISKYHADITILHCISEYPTQHQNVNLNTIKFLRDNYPNFKIGFSDHTIGILAPSLAVALGAEVIEKHITIDRKMKGTDHSCSLGADGVQRMVRDIRITEISLGKYDMNKPLTVSIAQKKLERSIATSRNMKKGDVITLNDICLLSPGDGYRWNQRLEIIGKICTKDISANEIIYQGYFK